MRPDKRQKGPQALDKVLSNSSGTLGKLLRHAESVNELACKVARLLDPELRKHCHLANARDGKLVFVCTSAAWSSRLLMQAPEILASLRAAGVEAFTKIEVKTRPGPHRPRNAE